MRMNFAVKHENKISTFLTYQVAKLVAQKWGGTLHHVLAKQDGKPVLGKELSLDIPKD